MKRLHIFRAGKHTAENGRVIEFSDATLAATAAAYDPAKHESPIVIGHPQTDMPAYGWAKSLAFAGGALVAEPHQVEPQFAEMVKAGRFKKISSAFYLPESAANPVPGTYYLKHIGFLGAQAPAVKGLKHAEFSEDEDTVEFSEWIAVSSIGSALRRLRDWMISKFGLEEADTVLPDYYVKDVEESAARAREPAATAFSEHTTEDHAMTTKEQELAQREEKIKADAEKLAQDQVAFAERDRAAKEAQAKQRREALAARIGAAVKAGRLLPKDQAAAVAFACSIGTDTAIEFAEGDKTQKADAAEWFLAFAERLPIQVDLTERGKGGVEGVGELSGEEIAAQALEYKEEQSKAGREITVTQAVTYVKNKAAGSK